MPVILSVEGVRLVLTEKESLFLSDTLLCFMDCFEDDELPLAASVCRKLFDAVVARR